MYEAAMNIFKEYRGMTYVASLKFSKDLWLMCKALLKVFRAGIAQLVVC